MVTSEELVLLCHSGKLVNIAQTGESSSLCSIAPERENKLGRSEIIEVPDLQMFLIAHRK